MATAYASPTVMAEYMDSLWTFDENDIHDENLSTMYGQMRGQLQRYVGHVAGYIGGTYQTYYTRAQGGTTFEPTPLNKQKEALQWLDKNVLNEPVWMREYDYCKTMTRDTSNPSLRHLLCPISGMYSKSIFIRPLSSIIIFCGFISRCIIYASWACDSPSAN